MGRGLWGAVSGAGDGDGARTGAFLRYCRSVLSGMQVTMQAHVCILTAGCKGACSLGGGLGFCLGCWWIFASLTAGCLGGCCLGVLFRVMVRAHFCSIDGRVFLGAFFGGVLLDVLVCKHCYLGSMLVCFFWRGWGGGFPFKHILNV